MNFARHLYFAVFLAIFCSVVMCPSTARADIGKESRWRLPIGVNAGIAIHPKLLSGPFVGGEISLAKFRGPMWVGGYLDGVFDIRQLAGRFSLGPEIGIFIFGLDAGPVVSVREGETSYGFCVRPLLTFGILSGFIRWEHFLSNVEEDDFFEIGLLLRFSLI